MFTFIVSGYIPGTDFQLTFDLWFIMLSVMAIGLLSLQLIRDEDYDTKLLLKTLGNLDSVRYIDTYRLTAQTKITQLSKTTQARFPRVRG